MRRTGLPSRSTPAMCSGPERKHVRLPGYDYWDPGPYAVTICTHHRIHRFGTVDQGCVVLSAAGSMVQATWQDIAAHVPGTVLDTFVLMPNHLHAIMTLPVRESPSLDGLASLSDVVGWFKTLTTRRYARGVHAAGWPAFDRHLWRPSFCDHSVRGEAGLDRQRRSIDANPATWHEDPDHDPDR